MIKREKIVVLLISAIVVATGFGLLFNKKKIEKSLVTKYISNLEDKGLVEKKMLDKRKKGLYLIEDGKKAIKFMDEFIPDLQEKFKDLFTETESKLFISLLKKLKLRLEEVNEREF